jgi:hypothetical protein
VQATLSSPLVHLILRGVAELKKLQVEGFQHSSASLGRIGYAHGREVTIECRQLFSGLMTSWIVYKEPMYSIGLILGSSFHHLGIQSSPYPGRVGGDDIGRRYWTSTVGSTETQKTSMLHQA